MLAQNLGRLNQSHFWRDGSVGPNIQNQTVIVGALTNSGVFHAVAHAKHWTKDGVHWNQSNFLLINLGPLLAGWQIAAALLNREFSGEFLLFGQSGKHSFWIVNLNRSVSLDQIRRHFAWTLGQKPHGLGGVAFHADNQLLDVQNNVGDIFIDAGKTCERVRHASDFHAGDGRAFKA